MLCYDIEYGNEFSHRMTSCSMMPSQINEANNGLPLIAISNIQETSKVQLTQ